MPVADALLQSIAARKAALDAQRPLSQEAIAQLQAYYDVELTYTSNAIEGNTLTARETAEVIAHGITVGGKPLKDHLEVLDHHAALQWARSLAASDVPMDERTIRDLHARIVARSRPEIAGSYSQHARRVAGSAAVFANPAKIPTLMAELGMDLATAAPEPAAIFEIHFRLTAIHPFSDGNGRTARLLMNMMLLRAGYPPIAVRPEDRLAYLAALEHASVTSDTQSFQTLMHQRLDETLAGYLSALGESAGRG